MKSPGTAGQMRIGKGGTPMKRLGRLTLLLALLLTATAILLCAAAENSGYYRYKLLEDGTAEITLYTSNGTELSIRINWTATL